MFILLENITQFRFTEPLIRTVGSANYRRFGLSVEGEEIWDLPQNMGDLATLSCSIVVTVKVAVFVALAAFIAVEVAVVAFVIDTIVVVAVTVVVVTVTATSATATTFD